MSRLGHLLAGVMRPPSGVASDFAPDYGPERSSFAVHAAL